MKKPDPIAEITKRNHEALRDYIAVSIINAHFPNAADVAEGDAAYRRHLESLFFTDRRHKY